MKKELKDIKNIREDVRKRFGADHDKFNKIPKEHDGIYMFFSFDLVNSTLFKSRFGSKWIDVISSFYDIAMESMERYIDGNEDNKEHIKVWKYIGDQVLFYKKIHSRQELFKNILNTYYAQNDIYSKLCTLCESVKSNINLKACVFIAECANKGKRNVIYIKNIDRKNYVDEKYGRQNTEMDFLGPDIDAGFRIAEYTEKKKIVVSAKLTCLIYELMNNCDELFRDEEKKMIKSCFKIVSYEQLKGIWDNRFYPIIWYHHEWENFNKMFEYDEYFSSKIVCNLVHKKNNFNKTMYELDILPKIYNELNKHDEISGIIEYLKLEEEKKYRDEEPEKKYINSEVHCVAICFYKDEILLLKRSKKREYLSETWEFGGGQINSNESWKHCLERVYDKDFNLKLIIQENPIPIATYSVEKSDGITIPGIIFIANVESKEVEIKKEKYEDHIWIKIEEFKSEENFLKGKKCVDNMLENIQKAIEIKEKLARY